MGDIRVFNQEILSDKKYPLKEISFEKPGKHGDKIKQLHEVYYRPDAVAVLMVDLKEEKILLTRQFRIPTFLNGNESGYLVETCAGLIDDMESPEEAAVREAGEETGYIISNLQKVGGVYPSAGGLTEYVHLFIAEYDSKGKHDLGGGLEEEGENIENLEFGFQEAFEKVKNASFNDSKTLLLLQHFFLTREHS
jgi:GDP-mannose pyrophosphatase NudK